MSEGPRPYEDDLEDLHEEAPCGLLSTLPDGTIVHVNRTLLGWTGKTRAALLAGTRFSALLTMPGALLFENQCAPMLRLQGHVGEISLDLVGGEGRLPVLLSATTRRDEAGEPIRFRIVLFHAPTRREYERELVIARRQAEEAAEQLRISAELLAEHSALLIPIQSDLRVMPIIGAIDATRGRQIVRALLDVDANAGIRAVILDLTGVPELDEAAAATLRQAAAGLRLRGVRPILTGIRPAVASLLVTLELPLTGLTVCGTLQDGVALANREARGRR